MGADSESKDRQLECVECLRPATGVYFKQRGPFCIKHWLEALHAHYKETDQFNHVKWDTCIVCGKWGVVLMFGGQGPYCVPHYLYIAKERRIMGQKREDEEIDPSE